MVNLHRDERLAEAELPRKYVAYTPCYRKEAGGYRTAERGTLRGHQFNKVELFQFSRPDASDATHEELLGKAENLVRELNLHYRITRLAAEDTSTAMAKTYDIEVWLPSIERTSKSARCRRPTTTRRGVATSVTGRSGASRRSSTL